MWLPGEQQLSALITMTTTTTAAAELACLHLVLLLPFPPLLINELIQFHYLLLPKGTQHCGPLAHGLTDPSMNGTDPAHHLPYLPCG